MDCTELDILAGKNQAITANVIELPEGEKTPKLEWTTSNDKVAIYSNGQIRAKGGGEAVITCSATLADGTYIYEECKVHVGIPVASIAADVQSLNLKGGEKYKPAYTFRPDNASNTSLSFESSNPAVASVSEDGTIEGTGTGRAKIIATAKDGSGKSTTVSVNVVDNRISKETVTKLLMFATGNDAAIDIFTSDGMNYDRNKLHDYKYFDSVLRIVDEGEWTTDDGGNSWHIRGFLVLDKIYGSYKKYDFDIVFNGKNYILENGWCVQASKIEWLNKKDPSKYNEDSLANLDFYVYLTISPKQIGE